MERDVLFQTNALGERGGPVPASGNGVYRILVAGGSAAECLLLDQQTAWPSVVEALLNKPDSLRKLGAARIVVGNVGKGGADTQSVYRILERQLPRYQSLNMVLLMVGGSDVTHWLRLGKSALVDGQTNQRQLFAEDPGTRYRFGLRTSAMHAVAGMARQLYLGRTIHLVGAGKHLADLIARRLAAVDWIDTAPDPAPMRDSVARNLGRCIKLAQSKGARVIVVRQPWLDATLNGHQERIRNGFEESTASGPFFTHRLIRETMRQMDAEVESVCRDLGVPQVETLELVGNRLDAFYDFFHFTPKGSRRIAGAVAAAIGDLHSTPAPRMPRPKSAMADSVTVGV